MLSPSLSAPTMRIAIYRTSSIGDVVLATACLDLLSLLGVPTEVTWIGRGASLELQKSSWPDLKTLEVRRTDTLIDSGRFLKELSSMHFLVDLQANLRSRWLAHQLQRSHGVSYFIMEKSQFVRNRLILEARMRGRRKPLPEASRAVRFRQFELMCHALKKGLSYHLPLERRYGLDEFSPHPRLPVPEIYDKPWHKELRFGTWLAVAPGASYPTKAAPFETFVEVLGRLKKYNNPTAGSLGLVFLGDESDRQVARQLLDHLHWSGPVLNLAGKLTLFESAIALRSAKCLISNDSSLGHIAEAVDTPALVLFGPTIESFGFAPRMRESRAISTLTGCRPCSKHGKTPCRYDDKLCFAAIDLDELLHHLVTLLRREIADQSKEGGQGSCLTLSRDILTSQPSA